MEPRRMLDATPLFLGAVYIEEDTGSDLHGDSFEITFEGGAAHTQLTHLVIDGDQVGNFGNSPGFGTGDVFFDTVESGPTASNQGFGVDGAFPFTGMTILTADGRAKQGASVSAQVIDGTTRLELTLENFEAGDRLVFTIDVDEVEVFDPSNDDIDFINGGFDPLTSGAEFQGTVLTASFSADHYFDAQASSVFLNRYDSLFQSVAQHLGPGNELDLPDDSARGRDRSAGALVEVRQEALPITISGTVFHDRQADSVQNPEAGDHGISGVTLSLWRRGDDGVYRPATDRGGRPATTVTDADGNYSFGESWDLKPGVYEVRETQPAGYPLSVAAAPGTVGGVSTGTAVGTDTLSGIHVPLGGTSAVDFDFAETRPSSISGFVFHDQDNDGTRDSGEQGIGQVTIEAVDRRGQVAGTAVTDSHGFYSIEGLGPGGYTLVQSHPDRWIDGLDSPGTLDRFGIGTMIVGSARNPGDSIVQIELWSDEHGVDYNFGERVGSIEGYVHFDSDGDCVLDPDERGIAGVQMTLLDDAGGRRTVTTDQNGFYRFDDLPAGTFTLVQRQPDDFFDGGQHAGTGGGDASGANRISGIVIGPGDQVRLSGYNFCETLGSLSGFVYHDRDDDGRREPGRGEEAISGVTMMLYDARDGRPVRNASGAPVTATTDDDGFYRFDDLAPGVYRVVQQQPGGWINGKVTPGTVDGAANGVADGQADSIDRIDFTRPEGARDPAVGINYNFGERRGSLEGTVHLDLDGDCVLDPDERGIEGVEITLIDQNGERRTTTTDGDGRYRFDDLAEGVYTIVERQPDDYFDGDHHAGDGSGDTSMPNVISGISVGPGSVRLMGYDFCEHLGSLSGHVYHDRDDDGHIDRGEEPIAGVTVTLFDAAGRPVRGENGEPLSRTTDENGFYEFTGLSPGVYRIVESQPTDWLDGTDSAGTVDGHSSGTVVHRGDAIDGIDLTGALGSEGIDFNFGELLPGSISGFVHTDLNGNCAFEPGRTVLPDDPDAREVGLSGVTVQLLDDSGNVLATTTTDRDGGYRFDGLRPGTYSVREIQPEGYFDGGGKNATADDHAEGDVYRRIAIASGRDRTDYNFCEIPPGTIAGRVFQDGPTIVTTDDTPLTDLHLIRDGKYDDSDTPLSGVVIELRDGITGAPIDASAALPGIYGDGPIRVVTDASGEYQFVGLPRGSYAVYEIQPANYIDGIDTPGTRGGYAFNQHVAVPSFVVQALTSDPGEDAIVRIELNAGAESAENNFSEVLRELDRGIIIYQAAEPRSPDVTAPVEIPLVPSRLPLSPIQRREVVYRNFGGGTLFTWHLSVIDAGMPRGVGAPAADASSYRSASMLSQVHWENLEFGYGQWSVHGAHQVTGQVGPRESLFGIRDAVPVVGDFNGDGISEFGVFIAGEWFIDLNGNGRWDSEDLWARLGDEGDLPVTGDWDGDGKDDIGIYGPAWPGDPQAIFAEPGLPDPDNHVTLRPSEASPKNIPPNTEDSVSAARLLKLTIRGETRADVVDHVFRYGASSDVAVSGDWNGDGIHTIGVFHNGRWNLDMDGDGKWSRGDLSVQYGREGDVPVVGDFDGDGVDNIGVFRKGTWILDVDANHELDAHDKVFQLGHEDDIPVVGDFDGDGIDEPGRYRPMERRDDQVSN